MSTQNAFISNFINIYVSPSETFYAIKNRPSFLYPLILLIFGSAIILLSYYSLVDFEWMNEQIILMSGTDLSTEEKEQMRDGLAMMSPLVQGIVTIIGASIGLVIYILLLSLYLLLVSMIISDDNSYKNWFSVVCWSFMPMLFTVLASGINISLMSNNQFRLDELNPLSFNNLFFRLDFDSAIKPLLDSLDLTLIWVMVLLVIGYQKITNKSWLTSTIIVLLPYTLVYGIWFIIIV
ncbi:MAG: YIP1 family protein [Thiohalomonadales bacterium]